MDTCYMPNNPSLGGDIWRHTSSPCSESTMMRSLQPYEDYNDKNCSKKVSKKSQDSHYDDSGLTTESMTPPLHSYTDIYSSPSSPMGTKSQFMDVVTSVPSSLADSTSFEPLPHFVTLSSHLQYKDVTMLCKEKGDHMADVLLSLKHAVVHPHQVGALSPPPDDQDFTNSPIGDLVSSNSQFMTISDPVMASGDLEVKISTSEDAGTSIETNNFLSESQAPEEIVSNCMSLGTTVDPSSISFHMCSSPPSFVSLAPMTPASPNYNHIDSNFFHLNNLPMSGSSFPDIPTSTDYPDEEQQVFSDTNLSFTSFINSGNDIATASPSNLPSFLSSPSLISSYNITSDDGVFDSEFQGTSVSTTNNFDAAGVDSLVKDLTEADEQLQQQIEMQTDSYSQGFSSMMGGTACGYSTNGYQETGYPTSPPMFPAMSVNVSMNMTMGMPNVNMGYSPEPTLQHQWPPSCGGGQGSAVSPMACMNYSQHSSAGNLVSPLPMSYSTSCNQPYGVGTYSWASDLRPDASSFERDFCIKSPPLRPRPGTPQGTYLSPGHSMGSPGSPTLNALRRRSCVANINPGLMDKSLCGEGLKTNLCRICGKTYARPSTLKTHLRTHSGEKPYRCNECNKSFSQAANLTAHVRTHSGEKPFRCPICDRRFSQSSSVTTHMRTHSGERPYRCRMCKKAFSDSSTLTKHLRIHSGEKPYQCKLCLLRFSQSGNLNRHMRVHAQAS